MTEMQRRFCEYYAVGGTAKQAMIDAGYSPKTGLDHVLRSPEVNEYLGKLRARRAETVVAGADEVLGFLTAVMRGEELDFVVDRRGGEVSFVKRQPTLKERLKAAELLGKKYAMFVDNVNVGALPSVVFSEIDIPE